MVANISSVASPPSMPGPHSTFLPLDTIRRAYSKNLFSPYEQELKGNNDHSRAPMFDTIKKIGEGKDTYDRDVADRLHSLYLFAIAIDPDAKKEVIPQYIATLDKKVLEFLESLYAYNEEAIKSSLHFALFRSLPAVMTAHILRFCSDSTWRNGFRILFKYGCQGSIENLFRFLQSVMHNSWSIEEKRSFLDRFFTIMRSNDAEELFFYGILTAKTPFLSELTATCSKSRGEYFTTLYASIEHDGQKLLKDAEKEKFDTYIRYSGFRRLCLIDWLIQNVSSQPVADYIVASFHHFDWMWIEEQNKPITPYVLQWMIAASLRPCEEDVTPLVSCHVSCLYAGASKWVEKHRGYCENPEEKKLAETISPIALYHYSNSFEETFRQRLLRNIIQVHSQKIIEWLQVAVRHQEQVKIAVLFQYVESVDSAFLLRVCNSFENSSLELFIIYYSLDSDHRKKILTYILSDRNRGLTALTEWISEHLKKISYCLKNSFSNGFYDLLCSVDQTLASELKDRVKVKVKEDSGVVEYLDCLLPVGVDMSNPLSRQKVAIKKLRNHLLTRGISHRERSAFISDLREDLETGSSEKLLVRTLIREFPHELWPFLFLHFERTFCKSRYDDYFEEKSKGATFNEVDKDAPPIPVERVKSPYYTEMLEKNIEEMKISFNQLLTLERAIKHREQQSQDSSQIQVFDNSGEWIEMAAVTFCHIVDNPYVDSYPLFSGEKCAMQNLYQAACETNAIYHIIKRFMQIAPEKFIYVMNRFASHVFYHNSDGFRKLVRECIMAVDGISRCQLIVRLLQGYYLEFPALISIFGMNVEDLLWEDGYTKDDAERASITVGLFDSMQIKFLECFLFRKSSTHKPMIESLYKTSPQECKILFYRALDMLCMASKDPATKLVIFQNFVSAYKEAGVGVISWLSKDACPQIDTISSWYALNMKDPSIPFDWWLLQSVKPDLFYSAALQKLAFIFDKQDLFAFSVFIEEMKKLGCFEELNRRVEADARLVEKMKSFGWKNE